MINALRTLLVINMKEKDEIFEALVDEITGKKRDWKLYVGTSGFVSYSTSLDRNFKTSIYADVGKDARRIQLEDSDNGKTDFDLGSFFGPKGKKSELLDYFEDEIRNRDLEEVKYQEELAKSRQWRAKRDEANDDIGTKFLKKYGRD